MYNKHTAEFQTQLFQLLNKSVDYVVLRNFEGLPQTNDSRDIDIAVSRGDYALLKHQLLMLIEKLGWKIVTYLYSDRLITWVVGYIDGNHTTELIQLDFFFNTSVFGIELMSINELLNNRQFNGDVYYPAIEIQFLDKYLYDRAVGAPYPKKYQAVKEAAQDSPVVRAKLRQLFGVGTVEECDKTSGRKLLGRAIGWNLRHRPFGLVSGITRFLQTFTGNYLMSRTGFSVGFTGPDGSGKTTVIDRTIERLGDVFALSLIHI